MSENRKFNGKEEALEFLESLGREIATQDNLCTEHVAFEVRQYRRVYGMDASIDDVKEVLILDGEEYEEGEECPEDAERVGYIEESVHVQTFLTSKAAREYIEMSSHRLTKPYVFGESFHRNSEMIRLRQALTVLAKTESEAGE